MLTRDLDFDLPSRLIAQTPIEPRDAARLLVLERSSGRISHRHIRDLIELLQPGDLLVGNDSRVLRARLRGFKLLETNGETTRGARVEALLLRERARNEWEALVRPSARLKPGMAVVFEAENATRTLRAHLEARVDDGWHLVFDSDEDVRDLLPELGEVPLPPYIAQPSSEERYQTVWARSLDSSDEAARPLDSAAAPTAGLHFTPELLEKLRERGVETAFVTLAVGVGTFRPVSSETLDDHVMHAEAFWIGDETARRINCAKREGRRVVAIGTTSVRALESAATPEGEVRAGDGETRLFLRPGAHFHIVDALLTNFHLPRSTLLALVAAFVENGRDATSVLSAQQGDQIGVRNIKNTNGENRSFTGLETVLDAYRIAVENEYRFFSFGDAMLIQ